VSKNDLRLLKQSRGTAQLAAGSKFPLLRRRETSLVFAILIALASCAGARATPKQLDQTDSIAKGQIQKSISCLENTSQSYALYLPSNYTPTRVWPIIYAFDPGARGAIAVERFKLAAEKYGWIVAGSNNSRNGPMQQAVDAWNAMSKDTHQRFSIDDDRVYITGFSGGARVAVEIASRCHDCVTGVIACGAGFPIGMVPSSSMHFLFFGTAGLDDFNFAEVKELSGPLTKARIIHRIEVFSGGHEWPPSNVTTAALGWMELYATKTGKRPPDKDFIGAKWEQDVSEAKALETSKRSYDAYQAYLNLVNTFRGLRDVSEIENKVTALRESREVKDAIREEQAQIKKQRQFESQLRLLLARPEPAGSNPEEGIDPRIQSRALLADLRKQAKETEDTGARRIARRVLSGFFVGLIEQGLDLMQREKNYRAAISTFSLAAEVQPERPGALFYLAVVFATNGDRKKSMKALVDAVEKGFSDLNAITNNKAFDLIRNDPEYQQIVARLSKN